MRHINCLILISGNGSNLQSIINAKKNNNIKINIKAVLSNKKNAYGLERAIYNNIPTIYMPYIKSKISREHYDNKLADKIEELNVDLIICAGWMHILSEKFLKRFKNVINLHPALPGMFPGNNSIEDAYNSFKKNNVDHTGIMVHHVIPEIDAGKVICTKKVNILNDDSLNDLKSRIQYYEKNLLIMAVNNVSIDLNKIKSGKVRDLYEYADDNILISHTDRLSSFDRNICDIRGKGNILCLLTKWWFDRTNHIIPNHVVKMIDTCLVVKKCTVIPIEFVVRGYITGSTSTSLWTHYNKGERTYCGISFPDGLLKNQRLDTPVLTPTTKDEHDEPLSCEDIVSRGILSQEDLDFIKGKAMELFTYGQQVSEERGLILVDTKYEFGRDSDGNIILIDEVHTCDSSRFWKKSSYDILFNARKEPEKLDKDSVRDYVKSVCDPYDLNKEIPTIPADHLERVYNCYKELYEALTGDKIKFRCPYTVESLLKAFQVNSNQNVVIIFSGSTSDDSHIKKIEKECDSFNIDHHSFVCSAHKETQRLLDIITELESDSRRKIYVTVAGRSNALSGVVACNVKSPVIACPPFKDKMDMMVNVHSSLQCPSKTPVMTILEPNNVAITCRRIFDL